ncbi:hypothetical protein ACFO3J_16475 [Streptomyces polygonati]|uniref:Resolvase/invertase-type recombinase catalytic domain-containing protein n=1 Tax=Streptomyces polygonati TaxID=1617087 RepID=A0ABV8HQM2_9ACTN
MPSGMYGYMRLAADSGGSDEGAAIKEELTAYATREGFTLTQLFVEQVRAGAPAFDCLATALQRGGVHDVIVPSLWHFAQLPGLQMAMRDHIEKEIGARIWIVQGVQP